jgi:hypothetical protein
MPFDPTTQRMLEYQARRLHYVLHETVPPDRKEAGLIQRRVDDILDRRPREPSGVAPDGEVIWPDSSSWVADQALPDARTIAVNATPDPEPVLPTDLSVPGGGVAVLDRPRDSSFCALCWSSRCEHVR